MTANVENDLDWEGDNGICTNWRFFYKYPSDEYISLYKSTLKVAISELLDMADRLYSEADMDTTTQRMFLDSIASHFGMTKLEKGARQMIKQWLRDKEISINKNNPSNLPDKESPQNHLFSMWSKLNRTKNLLDKVTASDIA
jgi:hypothetical protein